MNRVKYSEAVTAYIPKEMKTRLLMLKALDRRLHTTSKIIVGALELYLPIFEEKIRRAAKSDRSIRPTREAAR